MAKYTVKDNITGRTIVLEGDHPPTPEDLESLFGPAPKPAAAPQPSAPEPVAPAESESGPSLGTTAREIGTQVLGTSLGQAVGSRFGSVGRMAGGAVGGGTADLINQAVSMYSDPSKKFDFGRFVANTGLGGVPGGSAAKTGAGAVAKEAVKQGAAGVAAAGTEKMINKGQLLTAEEMATAGLPAAVLGGGAQKLFSSGSKSAVASALANKPKELQTLEAGAARGLKIVPSDADPSFVTTQLESLGGKAAVNQRIQLSNADAVDNLAKASIGVAKDVELSPTLTKSIRATESNVYKQIDALAEKAKQQLDVLEQNRNQILNTSSSHQAQINLAAYDAKFGKQMADLSEQAAASVEDLRKVRGETQGMWDAYFSSAGKNVDAQQKAIQLQQQAEQLSASIDATLRKTGHATLADKLDKARTRIARTYNIDEMMNPGTYHIDPDVALRMTKRGVPLGDELKLLAEFKAAFPNSLRDPAKVTSPDVSALGMAGQGILAGTVGLTTGNLPLAAAAAFAKPVASRAAREYLLSPGVQERAISKMLPEAVSPLSTELTSAATRSAGQQVGQQMARPSNPPPDAVKMLIKNPKLSAQFDAKYGQGSAARYLQQR